MFGVWDPNHFARRRLLGVCALMCGLSCLASASCSKNAVVDPKAAAPGLGYANRLASFDEYWSLAGERGEVKYLVQVGAPLTTPPFQGASCVFQNTARYRYHLEFLRTLPEYATLGVDRYEDLVLHASSRAWWGGGLRPLSSTPHPITLRPGTLAYTAYLDDSDPADFLRSVSVLDSRLKACAPFLQDSIAFLPEGSAQLARSREALEALRAQGIAVLDPDAIAVAVPAAGYSQGQSYGYLRVVRPGETAGASSSLDILVIDGAPNDLGVVAGLLTARPQSVASHVNLRLREKSLPNASVSNIFENQVMLGLENRLVHFVVRGDEVSLEPARLADAEAWWGSVRPQLALPDTDLRTREFRRLEQLGAADASAYGVKAVNLGELHRVLSTPHVPVGFAIPFAAYAEFVSSNALDAKIDDVLASDAVRLDAARKQSALAAVRGSIVGANLSGELCESLLQAVLASFGEQGLRMRLRFRSSASGEDLAHASSAGLYDSKSGCLADDLDADDVGPSLCLTREVEAYYRGELGRRQTELAEHPERVWLAPVIGDLQQELGREKSAYAALKKVWASLWNERAFDERVYYGVDQRRAQMAVAVHAAQVAEQLEAVAFTNLEPDSREPLFRLVSQVGETGVVQPVDPSAEPEITSFRRSEASALSEVTLVKASSLSSGTSLWSEPALQELGAMLFAVQDHFATNVYSLLNPVSLDVEVDVSSSGTIIVKQVRPYHR